MPTANAPNDTMDRLRRARIQALERGCVPLARIALGSQARELVLADARRWPKYAPLPLAPARDDDIALVAALVAAFPEFRTLLYYRLARSGGTRAKSLVPALRKVWRPHPTLRFHPDELGPGCFILHGYATGIAARSIGSNFIVGQHVVVGYKSVGKAPTIGDDVTVYVGAIVIGDITIGDGAVIGAGAVVVHDVPAGATVVGPAARELEKR